MVRRFDNRYPLLFFFYRTGFALYHNYQLRQEFSTASIASPYQKRIPMEQMDLNAYLSYFPNVFSGGEYSLTHRIKAPISLQYYTEVPTNDTVVALEIAKNTPIVAIPEGTKGSAFYEVGYGYTSYPTYEKGWRYVRPFKTTKELDSASDEKYYYVKLESLESVLDKAIEVNRPFRVAVRQQNWIMDQGKHIFTRYIDDVLYQHGAYFSPDLFYRVFDRWNVMLLSAIGVIGFTLLRKKLWFLQNRK